MAGVAVGVPPGEIFTEVLDFSDIGGADFARSIKLQIDSIVPDSQGSHKVDWVKLGPSQTKKGSVEVLINSVSNEFVEKRLDAIESMGFRALAFEPRNIAIARAVTPSNSQEAAVIIDINQTRLRSW